MVEYEALAIVTVVMLLVLRRDEHGQDVRAQLLANVLHELAIGTTRIDARLANEVGSQDASIHGVTSPPILPLARIFGHSSERLREECVAIATIRLTLCRVLRCLKSIEIDLDAIVVASFRLTALSEILVLQTVEAEGVRPIVIQVKLDRGRLAEF